ncbi:hypothetical protein CEUSTIGMA_g9794.t1 [Chlamydomonas eustigma]|uniref:Uncharacterized protein n=1 Tax=Chlamydomonas eustigma TaxID=1157962 RepID=A0A250XH07_9CHLO|nr:hypothetical protein CEUSTIGMA_g9794.t1 [Chlamydomonas eustigma]|eukprot:GAX82365.1 hypothetical protein CEUSTIGMA_g9794.t1 [Chlamydomonas eustigma]
MFHLIDVAQDVSATPTSPAAGAMNYEALENATNTSQIEAAGGYGDRSLLAAGGTGGQLPQDKKLKLAFSELQNCPDSAQMNSQVLHAVKGTDSSSSEPAAYTAADIAFKNKNRGLAVSEYSEQLVATHPDVVGISSSAANKLNEGVPSALSESCVLCCRYRHNVKIQLDLSRCLDGKEREHMVHKQVSTCVFLLEDDEAGVPLRDCDVVKALEEKKLLLGHEIGSSATSDTSSGGTPHQSSLSMNTFHQSSMAVSILEVVDVLGAPVLLWDSKDELRIYDQA